MALRWREFERLLAWVSSTLDKYSFPATVYSRLIEDEDRTHDLIARQDTCGLKATIIALPIARFFKIAPCDCGDDG